MRRDFPKIHPSPPYHSQEIASFGDQPQEATSMLNEELRRIATSTQALYDKIAAMAGIFAALGIDVDKIMGNGGGGGGGDTGGNNENNWNGNNTFGGRFNLNIGPWNNSLTNNTNITNNPAINRLLTIIQGPIPGEITPGGTTSRGPDIWNTTRTSGCGLPGLPPCPPGVTVERFCGTPGMPPCPGPGGPCGGPGQPPCPGPSLPMQPLKLYHSALAERRNTDEDYTTWSAAFEVIAPEPDKPKRDNSGLIWKTGTSYDGSVVRYLGHYPTSHWNDETMPLNLRRLFPTSWMYAQFPAGVPDLKEWDGSMKLPYGIVDSAYDDFGHISVAKVVNFVDLVIRATRTDTWIETVTKVCDQPGMPPCPPGITNIINHPCPPNMKPNPAKSATSGGSGATDTGTGGTQTGEEPDCIGPDTTVQNAIPQDLRIFNRGLAWKDVNQNGIAISDPLGKYNTTAHRYIGHGKTSMWTVGVKRNGVEVRPKDEAKGEYYPAHHFFVSDWNEETNPDGSANSSSLANPQQAVYDPSAELPNDRGTSRAMRYNTYGSVMTDLFADDFGHVLFAKFSQLRPLYFGRGLIFETTNPFMEEGYVPTNESIAYHPATTLTTFTKSSLPSGPNTATTVFTTGLPYFPGHIPVLRSQSGPMTTVVNGQSYPSNAFPTAFYTNDSGHLLGVEWSPLPILQGPQGLQGPSGTLQASVRSTTTLIPGSSARVLLSEAGGSTPQNRNYLFDFEIPRGADGISPTVTADMQYDGNLPANTMSVLNIGTPTAAYFRFFYNIVTDPPPPPPPGTGVSVVNYGFYEPANPRSLVWNPGPGPTIYIKRIGAEESGALTTFELGDTVVFTHKNIGGTWASQDWLYEYAEGWGGISVVDVGPKFVGDAENNLWRFPKLQLNKTGHIVNSGHIDINIGEGGGTPITTFPLFFGNALSQSPDQPQEEGFKYDPLTGNLTVHANNNTRDLAGVVEKGSNAFVPGVVSKVYGTDKDNHPHWRETVIFRGGQNIDIEYVGLEDGVKVYVINFVPY